MMSAFDGREYVSIADLNYLRAEAMTLFEHCLTEGRPELMEAFFEDQIVQDPPRLQVLLEVADDLHQRLITLRENHFDVRERVLRTLREAYSVDLSVLAPPDALESYHQIKLDDALGLLRQNSMFTTNEEAVVRKTLDTSFDIAAALYQDVLIAEHLYNYAMDWVMGLNASLTRRYLSSTYFDLVSEHIH